MRQYKTWPRHPNAPIQDLAVRSNSSASSGLKSRRGAPGVSLAESKDWRGFLGGWVVAGARRGMPAVAAVPSLAPGRSVQGAGAGVAIVEPGARFPQGARRRRLRFRAARSRQRAA